MTPYQEDPKKDPMHQEDPKKGPPSGGPERDHDPKKDPLTGDPRGTPNIRALSEVLTRHPLGSQGLATLVNIKEAKGSYKKKKTTTHFQIKADAPTRGKTLERAPTNKPRVATKPSSQKGS